MQSTAWFPSRKWESSNCIRNQGWSNATIFVVKPNEILREKNRMKRTWEIVAEKATPNMERVANRPCDSDRECTKQTNLSVAHKYYSFHFISSPDIIHFHHLIKHHPSLTSCMPLPPPPRIMHCQAVHCFALLHPRPGCTSRRLC